MPNPPQKTISQIRKSTRSPIILLMIDKRADVRNPAFALLPVPGSSPDGSHLAIHPSHFMESLRRELFPIPEPSNVIPIPGHDTDCPCQWVHSAERHVCDPSPCTCTDEGAGVSEGEQDLECPGSLGYQDDEESDSNPWSSRWRNVPQITLPKRNTYATYEYQCPPHRFFSSNRFRLELEELTFRRYYFAHIHDTPEDDVLYNYFCLLEGVYAPQ